MVFFLQTSTRKEPFAFCNTLYIIIVVIADSGVGGAVPERGAVSAPARQDVLLQCLRVK